MSISRSCRWFLAAIDKSQSHHLSRIRSLSTTACRHAKAFPPRSAESEPQPAAQPARKRRTPVSRYQRILSPQPHSRKHDSGLTMPKTRRGAALKARTVAAQIAQRAEQEPVYTPEQVAALSQLYTPTQMECLLAAEKAIDPEDIVSQGKLRNDPAMLPYLDDLANVDPILDKLRQGPEIKGRDGILGVTDAEMLAQARLGMERGEKAEDGDGKKLTAAQQRLAKEAVDPHMQRLMQQTGFTIREIGNLRVKELVRNRVANQTRIGKVLSTYVLTIAGNGDGLLGIGEGKSIEYSDAVKQAMRNAVRNMKPVHRYEKRTIFGTQVAKVGAAVVELRPGPPGFGVRTQHLIFEMARAAGIADLGGKCLRSRNPMNVCKATLLALQSQKLPEDIARGRGLKMVDVRHVYYAGKTL